MSVTFEGGAAPSEEMPSGPAAQQDAAAVMPAAGPPAGRIFALGWLMSQLFDQRRFGAGVPLADPGSQLPAVASLDPDARRELALSELADLLASSGTGLSCDGILAAGPALHSGPGLRDPGAFRDALALLHQSILARLAADQRQLSAYQLGVALSDLCWLAASGARPEALVQAFGSEQVTLLKARIAVAGTALPPSAAAVVARSLDWWHEWVQGNVRGLTGAAGGTWARLAGPARGALREQGSHWQALLAGNAAEPDPGTLAWVAAGASLLRASGRLTRAALAPLWPAAAAAAALGGGALFLAAGRSGIGALRWQEGLGIAAGVCALAVVMLSVPVWRAVRLTWPGLGEAARTEALARAVTVLPAAPRSTSRSERPARAGSRGLTLLSWAGIVAVAGAVTVIGLADGGVLGLAGPTAQLATGIGGGAGALGLIAAAGSQVLRKPPESWPAGTRHVNSLLWRSADHQVLQSGEVMQAGAEHVLGIGIGPPEPGSLLADSVVWPDDVLAWEVPRRARRLAVIVWQRGAAGRGPDAQALYLPSAGAGFTCPRCDALPASTDWESVDHAACSTGHRELAEFRIPPLAGPGPDEVDVLIYAGAALVHKHVVRLSAQPGPGVSATETFTLARTFSRLPDLIDRTASIDVAADHLTVNALGPGVPGGAGVFNYRLSAVNWGPLALEMRKKLEGLHFRDGTNRPRYPQVEVPYEDYRRMLAGLAVTGSSIFDQIFNTPHSAALTPLLRYEAAAQERPPAVQIARTADRPYQVPWQVLYDLPMDADPDAELITCPSVKEYGPGGTGAWPPPALCPHPEVHDGHDPDTALLCPWGFWGLAAILEVPEPPQERDLDEVISAAGGPLSVVAGSGSGLDRGQLSTHLQSLSRQIAGFPPVPDGIVTEVPLLRRSLEPSDIDIVYLISHAEPTNEPGKPLALMFKEKPLSSVRIGRWNRNWPRDHWRARHPLVILNACHTVEATPSMLGGFVTNFVAAGAAGVIGTETLIDQRAASEAMEHFLVAFSGGATAGEAIRAMRWQMLKRGSMLGFAYTPYCAASLRARLS